MALTLVRILLPTPDTATAVFIDDAGTETAFEFMLGGHPDSPIAHPEETFSEAYLALPGPDIPQAHELARLVGALLLVRAQPLPVGEELAQAWANVSDELEHDLALQQEGTT